MVEPSARRWNDASPAGRPGSKSWRRYVSVTRRFRAPSRADRSGHRRSVARSRLKVRWTTRSESSVRTRVRRSSAAATGMPANATWRGPRTGNLERLRGCCRQTGQQVGGPEAARTAAGGQAPKLGMGRLGHLVDQPLSQPGAEALSMTVQPGGQLDRPGKGKRGEYLAGVELATLPEVSGAQVDQAPAGLPCVLVSRSHCRLVPSGTHRGIEHVNERKEPAKVLIADGAVGVGCHYLSDQAGGGGFVVVHDSAQCPSDGVEDVVSGVRR